MEKSENQTAIPFLRNYVDLDIKSLPEVFDRLSLTENGSGGAEMWTLIPALVKWVLNDTVLCNS